MANLGDASYYTGRQWLLASQCGARADELPVAPGGLATVFLTLRVRFYRFGLTRSVRSTAVIDSLVLRKEAIPAESACFPRGG